MYIGLLFVKNIFEILFFFLFLLLMILFLVWIDKVGDFCLVLES